MLSFLIFFHCGKKAAITGKVIVLTGEGLEGVTVAIEKSAFKTITNTKGNYSIEYAPGTFKLTYSKPGYASHELELNLSTEMKFPAETIELCPIPEKNGIYILQNSEVLSLIQAYVVQNFRYFNSLIEYHISFSINNLDSSELDLKIKAGTLQFIDTYPNSIEIFRLLIEEKSGIIQEYSRLMDDFSYKYNGSLTEKLKKVGKEDILIRSIQTEPGIYAWVQVDKTFWGTCPSEKTKAFLFKVDSSE